MDSAAVRVSVEFVDRRHRLRVAWRLCAYSVRCGIGFLHAALAGKNSCDVWDAIRRIAGARRRFVRAGTDEFLGIRSTGIVSALALSGRGAAADSFSVHVWRV